MQKQLIGILVSGLVLSTFSATSAYGAKPTRGTQMQIESATFRDDSADVALSDGGGTYLSSDSSSVLRDFSPSQPDSDLNTLDQDYLSWRSTLGGVRFTRFNNAWASSKEFGIGSAQPIQCSSGGFYFVSQSTPDFIEVLQTIGESVTGFSSVQCWMTGTFKYQANYPRHPAECVTLTRSSETTLTLKARAVDPLDGTPCTAEIYTFDISGPTTQSEFLGYSSAPLEVTFGLAPSGPGNGKGHGKH